MNKKEQYYTIQLLKSGNTSELNYELCRELYGDNFDDDNIHCIDLRRKNKDERWFVDAYPININSLITLLSDLKNIGASHVSIDYHVDHNEYEYSALQITGSTTEEINNEKSVVAKYKDKQQKISNLYSEIEKIKNEQ